jgi:hypothetical protein
MNSRLLLVGCMLWACSRNDRESGGALPARPAASASTATSVDVSHVQEDAKARASLSPPSSGGPPHAASPAALPPLPGSILSIVASGYTSGLSFDGDTVSYCDSRGGRAWTLPSGGESAQERACPSAKLQERNSDCGEIEIVTAVREPGPDDIIDLKDAPSLPVHGHIHDCAFNSGVLLVATGMEVAAINGKTGHRDVKGKEGGNQVAMNSTWLAWSDGEKVFAQHR